MSSSADSTNTFHPGFDFMQKLTQGIPGEGGSSFPSWRDWVAPTMNVQELEKRIDELKTVLFWLEQNQRALSATIQAMEVQKMTLTALKTMNVPVDNWASIMMQGWEQLAQTMSAGAPSPSDASTPTAASAVPPDACSAEQTSASNDPAVDSATVEVGADPLQWWGALTQQFQHIAQQAIQDVAQHTMASATVEPGKQAKSRGAAESTRRAQSTPQKKTAASRSGTVKRASTAAKRPVKSTSSRRTST